MSDGKLTQEQREHIERLCAAMDAEHIPARMWFPPSEAYPRGGTILDACREMWIRQALQGIPLPEHWCDGDEGLERQMQERLAEHGTREWRKAYPWMVEDLRRLGLEDHERPL